MDVAVVDGPSGKSVSAEPCWNREPLVPNPFAKLPLGAVNARGWLKQQLDYMADGMTGRLPELSEYLQRDSGWAGTQESGWEELPYWLRGFYDLAVLTDRKDLYQQACGWIDTVLKSQDEDGYFGAPMHKNVPGQGQLWCCDLWPHMVMLDALRHHWEYTGDERVDTLMRGFFDFCHAIPHATFIPHRYEYFEGRIHVQANRAGDMLPHLYWLYNKTGDQKLLELAGRFYRRIRPRSTEWLDQHVVNFTQRFGYPGIYYQQSHQKWHLRQTEYWYKQHLDTWGQQPGGIFGADERITPGSGKVDPRQGFETCAFTEFAKNFYMLGRISGDPVYADRCEELMLNHFPAAQTPELKGLHYLTASNCPQLDHTSDHDFWNEHNKHGFIPQLSYTPHRYRCCQHNVAMGWPWYVQNMWQASADNGLASWLYGPSEVTAKVGQEQRPITVEADTGYPFDTRVRMNMRMEAATSFPLYLRVPRWCRNFRVWVNDTAVEGVQPEPGRFVRIQREWQSGDTVDIEMPAEIQLTEWPRDGSMTVNRGPLSYSVRIEETWQKCGGDAAWPEWEVLPASPWNYGLSIDRENPSGRIDVVEDEEIPAQPWTPEGAPIRLRAKGRRLWNWTLQQNQMIAPVPESPVYSDEAEETIEFIPMGCARLRVACLPEVKSHK